MVSGTRHSATGPEHENTMDADRGTEDHESEQYPLRVINDRFRDGNASSDSKLVLLRPIMPQAWFLTTVAMLTHIPFRCMAPMKLYSR